MAYPDYYTREFGYQLYGDDHPNVPVPGNFYDVEYDDISQKLNAVIDFIKIALRSDGQLQNGIVTQDSLASGLTIGGGGDGEDAASAATSAAAAADSATASAASAAAAATSASSASTSASTATTKATAAAASATAAASSESSASSSAANASTSASAASGSQAAAAASATAAASSASSASTSATAAASSASSASTSATTASTAATNAGTSATAAATSETNAAASATAAATSETNAAASATAAATSETNAAASATAAAASAASAAAVAGALVSHVAKSATTASQPGSPSAGDYYIVPAAGWSGSHANTLAGYDGSSWTYTALVTSDSYVAQDTGAVYVWTGSTLKAAYVSLARAPSISAALTAANALGVICDIDANVTIATSTTLNYAGVVLRPRGGLLTLQGTAQINILDITDPIALFDTSSSTTDTPVTLNRNPVEAVESRWFSNFIADGSTDIGSVWKHWINTRSGADYTKYRCHASAAGYKFHATATLYFPEYANRNTRQAVQLDGVGAIFDYRVSLWGAKGHLKGIIVDGSPVSGIEIGSVGKCTIEHMLAQNCSGSGVTFGFDNGSGPAANTSFDNALFIQIASLSNDRGFEGYSAGGGSNIQFTTSTFIQCQGNNNQKEGWYFHGGQANYDMFISCDCEGNNEGGGALASFYNDGFQTTIIGGQMTDGGSVAYTLKLTGANNNLIGTRLGGAIYFDATINQWVQCMPAQFNGNHTNSNDAIIVSPYCIIERSQNVTLSSNAFSAKYGSFFICDTQGGASTDNLDTINDIQMGQYVTVTIKAAARKITIDSGTGNLHLATGSTYQMTTSRAFVRFFSPDGSNLYEVGRG